MREKGPGEYGVGSEISGDKGIQGEYQGITRVIHE